MYLLSPPTRRERIYSGHPLFRRMSRDRGITLVKSSGLYRQAQDVGADEITAAEVTYLGGHIYRVSDAEAGALTDAGYGAWLTLLPDPYGDSIYNTGRFGVGTYGG